MLFTERLDILLKAKAVSRKKMGRQLGIPYSTICSWYVRRSSRISMVTLRKIANYFGVDTTILMDAHVNERVILKNLNRSREIFSNKKTEQLTNEIESLKNDPDITEFDIQIARVTSQLPTSRKAQVLIFLYSYREKILDGEDLVMSHSPLRSKIKADTSND